MIRNKCCCWWCIWWIDYPQKKCKTKSYLFIKVQKWIWHLKLRNRCVSFTNIGVGSFIHLAFDGYHYFFCNLKHHASIYIETNYKYRLQKKIVLLSKWRYTSNKRHHLWRNHQERSMKKCWTRNSLLLVWDIFVLDHSQLLECSRCQILGLKIKFSKSV